MTALNTKERGIIGINWQHHPHNQVKVKAKQEGMRLDEDSIETKIKALKREKDDLQKRNKDLYMICNLYENTKYPN